MSHLRVNNSLLASGERALLAALVKRLPAWVTPDHLTISGLFGALFTAAGFVACHKSLLFLTLVVFGLFLNWFGDSLDGTLARHRKIERPRYGYFVDHSCDLIAQTTIILGLGFSPFFSVPSALLVLSLYLLMSSYTYLKVAIAREHHLSYGGMGATEFRILIALWAMIAAWIGPDVVTSRHFGFATLDIVIGVLSMGMFGAFGYMVRKDIARIDGEGDSFPHAQTEAAPKSETKAMENPQEFDAAGELTHEALSRAGVSAH